KEFPDAEIVTRKSDDPSGFQFLNVFWKDFEAVVEWKPDRGFGVSCFRSDVDALEGAYDVPDEWFRKPEAAFHRVTSLLLDEQSTKAPPASLSEIRRERGLSQTELSAELEVTQATYSKMERRSDVKVSSLRRLAEAMGGTL